MTYAPLKNNTKLYDLTKNLVLENNNKPKFVYTHLMLPHYPYYFDKYGHSYPYNTLIEGQQINQKHYIEYLQYANNKLIHLITYIQSNTTKPTIIILMSDHGFRHFTTHTERKYQFMNLNAVFLPKDYKPFPDSLSNVNLFRVLLNNVFHQKLPMLKDSTVFLIEKVETPAEEN
jgi:hypothetical protein